MDLWDKFLEGCIADNKNAKKESREDEIHALQSSDKISDKIIQHILEQEKDWREYLDKEIERYRDWLMKRKEIT